MALQSAPSPEDAKAFLPLASAGASSNAAASAPADSECPVAQTAGPREQEPAQRLDLRAVWSLTSMSLGAGVFAIPSCFARLGLAHGAIWVIVLAFFACFCLERLLDLAALESAADYETLSVRCFGRAGKFGIAVITAMTTGVASLAYLSAAKSLLEPVGVAFFVGIDVNAWGGNVRVLDETREIAFLAAQLCAVLPLCLGRTMGASAWISALGVFVVLVSIVYFCGFCIYLLARGCGTDASCGQQSPRWVAGSPLSVPVDVAQLAFSYSLVFALFPVLQERVVRDNVATIAVSMKKVVRASCSICCVSYLFVGVMGALALGDAAKPIALVNLSLRWAPSQLVCLSLGTVLTLLFAVISFPTLQSVEVLLGSCVSADRVERWRPGLVASLGVVCIAIDAGLPTKYAFALTGSLGLASGGYILPCLLYLRLGRQAPHGPAAAFELQRDVPGEELPPQPTRHRSAAVAILIFGMVLVCICTPATLLGVVRNEDSASAPIELRDVLRHDLCKSSGGADVLPAISSFEL